jgi:hypothetical protein
MWNANNVGVHGVESGQIWPNPLSNPFNIHWVEFIIKPALPLSNPNRTNLIINGLGSVRGLIIELKIIFYRKKIHFLKLLKKTYNTFLALKFNKTHSFNFK